MADWQPHQAVAQDRRRRIRSRTEHTVTLFSFDEWDDETTSDLMFPLERFHLYPCKSPFVRKTTLVRMDVPGPTGYHRPAMLRPGHNV